MLKKTIILLNVGAAFFIKAQDASVISNSNDVYSNTLHYGNAKYNAMAGANGALGGDASSLLTNPAGLGVAISSEVSLTPMVATYKNTSSLNGSSIDYNKSKFTFGNIGGVFSFPINGDSAWKFVNIGYNSSFRNLDNYIETPGNSNVSVSKNLIDPDGNPVIGNMSYLGHAYSRTGTQSVTNVGIGANYNNKLYFGAGINVHYAELEQYDSAVFGLDIDNSSAVYNKQYTPYGEQSSGASFSLGVIGKVNNQLRLGVTLESPTWWQQERNFTDYYFDASGNLNYDTYAENRNFRSPMKATLSAAYVPNKNLALNVDYSVGLTKPQYRVDGPAETELNDFFGDYNKTVSEVKVGAEYRVKAMRLRAGYGFSSNPFSTINVSAFGNDGSVSTRGFNDLFVSNRNVVGLGLGYDFKSFFIDASYQNVSTKYNNPFLSGYEDFGTGYYSTHEDYSLDVTTPNSVVSEVKHNRNNFFLTVGWKF